MSLVVLFHFLCAQHVSEINIPIIGSLRLFCWITTLVYCSWFDVCWSFGVVGLEWYPCCRLQYVSDINISIIRSLRLFCWITTLVVLFLVRCVLEFRRGWFGVVSVLQAEACNTDTTPTQSHRISNTHRTKNNTTNVLIQQNSRKLLVMDILMSETCWSQQHGYHSKPTTPKLQHTSNQEQYDQCGNSTE